MIKFFATLIAALSVVLSVAAVQKPQPQAPMAIAGEYLVKIRLNQEVSEKSRPRIQEILKSTVKTIHALGHWVTVKRPSIERSDYSIQMLQGIAEVEWVEPNFIFSANLTPNDPLFSKQWGLRNVGQADSANHVGTPGVDMQAEEAWELTTGSAQSVLAVIDTGVDYNHPDLRDNVWVNETEQRGQPGVDDDGNGYVDDIYGMNFVDASAPVANAMDDHGHGSHCAGVIGGKGNDQNGIAGLNWNIRIMPVKFLDKDGQGSLEGAVLAVDYATKMGAKILSNSWGGGGFSQALKESIERSEAAGALFVAAAGNDSNNNDYQATYPSGYPISNILSVAAVDNTATLASFSNFGRKTIHVAAPGVNILSTIRGGGYESWSGTSMAAPAVSGIAALLLAQNPAMSAAQIKQRIVSTTKPYPQLKAKTQSGGLVSAYNALTGYVTPPDPNDPEFWMTAPIQISTAHPYSNQFTQEFEIELPGANEISLYFAHFETERNFDTVVFYDRAGNLLTRLSGTEDDTYSIPIKGSYVRLVFSTDDSVEKYGFDITKIAYR